MKKKPWRVTRRNTNKRKKIHEEEYGGIIHEKITEGYIWESIKAIQILGNTQSS